MAQDPDYLSSTDIVDWKHPAVRQQARALARSDDPLEVARACFEWVRDKILHSCDHQRNPTTCRASEVLEHRTGYCYAKSHLLAALLRANQIPAGLCYQRLSAGDSGPPYCLHGYNAVWLPSGEWYRIDARGNRTGVDARFTPPIERLAFPLQTIDEFDFDNILANPLQRVVQTLQQNATWQDVRDRLPDVDPAEFARLGLWVRRQGG